MSDIKNFVISNIHKNIKHLRPQDKEYLSNKAIEYSIKNPGKTLHAAYDNPELAGRAALEIMKHKISMHPKTAIAGGAAAALGAGYGAYKYLKNRKKES